MLLIISICFNYFQYVALWEKGAELSDLHNSLASCSGRSDLLKQKQLVVSRFANSIPLNTEVESISSGTSYLKNLSNERALIYSFSYLDCLDCAMKQLNLLTRLKNEDQRINVKILMAYDNSRSFKNFSKMSNDAVPIWGMSHRLPFPEQCYFVLEPDGMVHNFYIPEAADDNSTNVYLDYVKKDLRSDLDH